MLFLNQSSLVWLKTGSHDKSMTWQARHNNDPSNLQLHTRNVQEWAILTWIRTPLQLVWLKYPLAEPRYSKDPG